MLDGMKYRWRLRKLERQLNEIQRTYAKHRKGLSGEELVQLRAEEGSEADPVLEKIDVLTTRRFCQIANRLMVPLPDRSDEDLWEESPYGLGKVLTSKGIWELKKLIRQERRESREGFLWWLAALTGIVGAITGLVAVLTRH